MRDATLVTTQDQLDAAVFRMQGATRIALDTEFMRERTYYAQLCLVQVATDADCFLVDPCVGLELGPLHALLADRSRPKILHAARQDLEVLFMAGGRVPGPVFDTQVAAALLGLPPQVGYAELVARQLGHSIDNELRLSVVPSLPHVSDAQPTRQFRTPSLESLQARARALSKYRRVVVQGQVP